MEIGTIFGIELYKVTVKIINKSDEERKDLTGYIVEVIKSSNEEAPVGHVFTYWC